MLVFFLSPLYNVAKLERQGIQLKKSFYHYMMKHRAALMKNEISQFAEAMYDDLSFPKQSDQYEEISSYLELSGMLESMSIFDEAWDLYVQEG